MYFAYYDETGDDGFPRCSSPLFVFSAAYFHQSNWRANFNVLKDFRKQVRKKYGLKIKDEIHTKDFLMNAPRYRNLNIDPNNRVSMISEYCDAIAKMNLSIVNVVINKTVIRNKNYPVLDKALTYSVQRIDNDIDDKTESFVIITDKGRIAKMRKITRRVQLHNPIVSKFDRDVVVQYPLQRLLEDPLPKDSKDSYFIQVSDLVSYIVYIYMLRRVTPQQPSRSLPAIIDHAQVIKWLDMLLPVLNIKATSQNEHGYGIVCYPKP